MYTRVESRFWQDEKMRTVSSDAKHLMLYLLTSPHRNIIGFYFLPTPYACFDLGWVEERFNKGLGELSQIGVIQYDPHTHVVLIQNYLKHNPLENPNQVKKAIVKLDEVPQTPLFRAFQDALKQYSKPFVEPLTKRLGERLGQPGTGSGTGTGTEAGAPPTPPRPDSDKNNGNKDLKTVYDAFSENIHPVTPFEAEDLAEWVDDGMKPDVVIWAIREAVRYNKRYMKYIRGILAALKAEGITTAAGAEARERNRADAKRQEPGRAREPTRLSPEEKERIAELNRQLANSMDMNKAIEEVPPWELEPQRKTV